MSREPDHDGYRPAVPLVSLHSPVGRVTQKVAGSRAFARVAPHVVPPVDRLLHRLTGGRALLARGLLPGLVLTTTGRRSGQRRETPLMCVPEPEGSFLVLGSNFGREAHPAWTANLLAEPRASISYDRRDIPVTAELLEGSSRDQAWDRALATWPTFAAYAARTDREIRVFRLHPA